VIERDYLVGRFHLRLRFAGPALLGLLTPALAHLAAPPGQPELTVGLWESEHTGSLPPPPPWDSAEFGGAGLIPSFSTGRFATYFQLGANALSLLDHTRGQAYYWVRRARQVPYWDQAAPLRPLLSLWLNRRARLVVHAGAVGLPGGGVLLAGPGGSGKSNTALGTLTSALGYAGDDFTVLSVDPEPRADSLYSSGKLNPADLARLPFLEPALANRERLPEEKALFLLADRWPHKLLAGFPLRAVLLPCVSGAAVSSLRPAAPAEGLNTLAPSTFELSPAIEPGALGRLAELFRRVSCYHLDLGPESAQTADLIVELLQSALPPGAAPGPAPA
jgi:hypothetical protein